MARLADEKSKRQLAFAWLDKNSNVARAAAVSQLQTDLTVGESYAKTLFQAHRSISRKSGKMTPIFKIREAEGKVAVKIHHVTVVPKTAHTTAASAIENYINGLQNCITSAKALDPTAIEQSIVVETPPKTESPAASEESTTTASPTPNTPITPPKSTTSVKPKLVVGSTKVVEKDTKV